METKQLVRTDEQIKADYASAATQKFQENKITAVQIQTNLTALVIQNETTLAIATQTIGKAKDALKRTKDLGLAMRKPFRLGADAIMDVEKQITEPLEKAIEIGNEKLRKWNAEQKEKEREEKAKIEKMFNYLELTKKTIHDKISACNTPESCNALIESINAKWLPAEKFAPFQKESIDAKNNAINLLTAKSEALKGVLSNNPETAIDAIKAKNATEEQIKTATVETANRAVELSIESAATKTKVRKVWKYEIINAEILAKQFLSPDSVKINSFIKANKENWKDATEQKLEGIRFYLDETPLV